MRQIQQHGSQKIFPNGECHIIGDSAFPLKQWLMTPYKKSALSGKEKFHNHRLSSDRVCIEHTFGLLKGRFSRLHYINTKTVSKAIEIVTTACVLHNFSYLRNDDWNGGMSPRASENSENNPNYDSREDQLLGQLKRDNISTELFRN